MNKNYIKSSQRTTFRETRRTLGIVATILVWMLAIFAPQAAYAQSAGATALATTIRGWGFTAPPPGADNIITVTGNVNNPNNALTMTIPSGVTVNWQATLSFNNAARFLTIEGDGIFKMPSGSISHTVADSWAITCNGDVSILVEGGTLTGGIISNAPNSKVTVSSGTVTRNSSGTGTELHATINFTSNLNNGVNVEVMGNGKVEQTSTNANTFAIRTYGTVEVKGTATVSATQAGSAISLRSGAKAYVSGGTVESNTGRAIHSTNADCYIEVSGGIVRSTNSSSVIYIEQPNNNGKNILIKGNAQVQQLGTGTDKHTIVTYGTVEVEGTATAPTITSAGGHAIFLMANNAGTAGKAFIRGGTVRTTAVSFSGIYAQGHATPNSGSEIVITGGTVSATTAATTIHVGSNGIAYAAAAVIANTGNVSLSTSDAIFVQKATPATTTYTAGLFTDLTKLPADAIVTWDNVGGKSGINYERNANKGFLEIPGINVVKSYTVTITQPGNGNSITVKNGNDDVTTGTSLAVNTMLSLTATATGGYIFDKWWDGNSSPTRTVQLTEDITISATFTKTWKVNISEPENGKIKVMNGDTPVANGAELAVNTTLTLTAEPEDECEFVQWWDGNRQLSRTITLTEDVSINATFKAIEYTVTFVVTDEDGQVTEVTILFDDKPVTGVSVPKVTAGTYPYRISKTGYISQNDNVVVSAAKAIDGVVTVEILLEKLIVTYKVMFVVADEDDEMIAGAKIIFDGVELDGYEVEGVGEDIYRYSVSKNGYLTKTGNVTVNADNATEGVVTVKVTLIKGVDPVLYTVTFKYNDSLTPDLLVEVEDGQKVEEPDTPVKQDHEFIGWFDGLIKFNFNTPITGDITLTAKWKSSVGPAVMYTVTFDYDGGETVEVEVEEGDTVDELEVDPREGFEFLGWFLGDIKYNFNNPVTGDFTLVAKWKAIVPIKMWTVTFKYDNGTADLKVEVEDGEKVTKPSPNPTKEGFKFLGWFLGDELYDFNKPVTSNITLNAKWDDIVTPPTEYIVTFDLNYGDVKPEEVKVVEGEKVEKPKDPTRSGYKFEGWFEGTATESFNFDTPITKNITLKAKWTAITGSEDVAAFSLNVYPNPFTDALRIEGAEGCILQVITGNGAVVYTQKIESIDQAIGLEQLPKGLYIFRVEKDQKVKTLKVVKH